MRKMRLYIWLPLCFCLCAVLSCRRSQDDLARARTLYEQASAEEERQQVAAAIGHLHECLLLLESRPAETDFRRAVLSLLGDLYYEHKNYDECLKVYREFLALCETDRQKSIACHDLSSYYVMTEQADSALYYACLSLRHALVDGDSLKIAYRYHSLALAENAFQQPDSALLYARQALAYVPANEPKGTYYYAIGTLLYDDDEADADSVAHYMALAAADTTYQGRFNTYYILSELAEEREDYPAALDYLYAYTDHLDSLYVAERGVDVQQLIYEYQTQLQVQQERLRNQRIIWTLLIVFILITSILITLWQYNKRRKAQLHFELDTLKREQEAQYKQSEQYIADNLREIARLRDRIGELGTENEGLRIQLEREIEKKEVENKLAELTRSEQMVKENRVKSSAVYSRLLKLADADRVMPADLELEVEALLSEVYPDFLHRLPVNKVAQPFEYQLCLLTKMAVRSASIAVLTSHTRSGVSRGKERLYAKFTGNVGKAADFNHYIRNLG